MSTYVTVPVAARRLGLSYDRTRILLRTRKLKGTQSGGRWGRLMVDVADLERLIAARRPRAF